MSAAVWLVARMKAGDGPRAALWGFIPGGFEAYARVFHPLGFGEYGDIEKTWAEVGAERGVVLSPDVSLGDVLGIDPFEGGVYRHPAESPGLGELPSEVCRLLIDLLTPHTTTPHVCWFCVWAGSGAFEEAVALNRFAPSRTERRAMKKRQQQTRTALDAIPKVKGVHTLDYFLYRGPTRAAGSFVPKGIVTPNIWWPDDRAWTVVTGVDDDCTFVCGGRAAIDDVLASDLEAIEVTPEDEIA